MIVATILLCFVLIGVLFLTLCSDKVSEIKHRNLRILTRFSIIFMWPVWVVVVLVSFAYQTLSEAFEELFK